MPNGDEQLYYRIMLEHISEFLFMQYKNLYSSIG